MIQYQIAHGVDLDNTALPSITITPEGKAMGAVPGWRMMIDPSYMVSGVPRNRALPNNVTTVPSRDIGIGTFGTSGSPSFEFYNDERGVSYIQGGPSFSPNEWSFVLPFLIPEGYSPGTTEFFKSVDNAPSGELSLRLTYSSSGHLAIFEGQSVGRLRWAPPTSLIGEPTLVIFTFSVHNGLNMFVNGELVESNLDDKRPLTQGFGENEWRIMGSTTAHHDLGIAGVLNTDLSLPENAGYRRAVERFLMAKYGII